MNEASVTELMGVTLQIIGLLSAPTLIASLVVGIITNLLQTITQVRDTAVSFIPKLVITSLVMVLTMPWCIQMLTGYWHHIIELFGRPVT